MNKNRLISLIKIGTDINKKAFSCLDEVDLEKYSINALCHINNIFENITKKYTQELLDIILNEEMKQIIKDKENIEITKIEIDKTNKSDEEVLEEIKNQLRKHLPKEIVNEILKGL